MTEHRSTHAKVSKEPENSNFDPGTALENLRAEIIDVEALIHAAAAAVDALPAPATDHQRVVFGRIEALTTKASEQASASLRRSPRTPRRWRHAGRRRKAEQRLGRHFPVTNAGPRLLRSNPLRNSDVNPSGKGALAQGAGL